MDRHVTTEDVLPTIADVLGVDVPWETTGHSALGDAPPDHPFVQVGKLKVPYTKVLAQRRRSLARQLALFGTGAFDWRFAGTGRFRTLVGKPVDSLNVVENLDKHAVVDKVGSKLLKKIPSGKPLVPSPLAGYLPKLRRGGWIALALNGRVAAVSHTYGTGGKLRFSLLASDADFRVGSNVTRMFVVSGGTAKPQLHELNVTLSP